MMETLYLLRDVVSGHWVRICARLPGVGFCQISAMSSDYPCPAGAHFRQFFAPIEDEL